METSKKLKGALNAVKTFKNFKQFSDDYFGRIGKKIILYKLRNGLVMYARPNRVDAIAIIETSGDMQYTSEFSIGKNDTVVDIGAHIGSFTLFAAKMAKRVYAFEPNKDNWILLKKNIAINKIKNVTAVNAAVSGKNGFVKLYVNTENTGGHRLDNKYFSKAVSIKSVNLQSIVKQAGGKIDFLKVDCEGAEYDILFKGKNVLDRVSKMALEYHDTKDFNEEEGKKKLCEFLKKTGFTVKISKKYPVLYASRPIFIQPE
ncbi:MAG: FkbM family methyltransferase [Candidatus Aenigmarchaeota archaeon]|nr:FkbM family methyltransferase [Candidatus Aenigmarchaeota archaeon]